LPHSLGETLLTARDQSGKSQAEDLFSRSVAISQKQGAHSWELRSAISIARLWRDSGRTVEARDTLTRVYERFTEGFSTRNLIEAKALLCTLH
jgi:predicted ATPase